MVQANHPARRFRGIDTRRRRQPGSESGLGAWLSTAHNSAAALRPSASEKTSTQEPDNAAGERRNAKPRVAGDALVSAKRINASEVGALSR